MGKLRYKHTQECAMHINVSDILGGPVGGSRRFDLRSEALRFDDLELGSPIDGQGEVLKTDDGLIVRGQAAVRLKLSCHRCLETFSQPITVEFAGKFTDSPEEDEWPIIARAQVDLAPLVRQELIVDLPIKQLCSENCAGLCTDCGKKKTPGHQHQRDSGQLSIRERMKHSYGSS